MNCLYKDLWQDTKVRKALAVALLIRLLFLGYLALHPVGIFSKGDSLDYQQLAHYLVYYHSFGREEISPEAIQKNILPPLETEGKKNIKLIPETFRTPVYPTFLALIFGFGGSPFFAVVVQSFLSLQTVWLIMLFMGRIFRPEAAWLAGLLAALDPLNLIYTHELMTESLFILFILNGIYSFLIIVTADEKDNNLFSWSIFGGVCVGLAMLTRPIGIYLIIFLIILWLTGSFVGGGWITLHRGSFFKTHVSSSWPGRLTSVGKYVVIFIVAMSILPSLWALRNYHFYNRFFISTMADHNLLVTITSNIVGKIRDPEGKFTSMQITEQLEKELRAKMVQEGYKNPSEPEEAAYFRNWSLQVIKQNPLLFLRFYGKGFITMFIPDLPGFYELIGLTEHNKGGLGAIIRDGLRPALIRYFGESWYLYVIFALPLIFFDLAIYGLAFWGTLNLWRSRDFFRLFLVLSIIVYWLAISAVGGAPRYRLPLDPFLIILSAWGWFTLKYSNLSHIQPPAREQNAEIKAG
jgi:hypothetical protein